jgi:hypothetical protein
MLEVSVVKGLMRSKYLNVKVDGAVVVKEGKGFVKDEFGGR